MLEKKKQYQKDWYLRNKEKVKQRAKAWYLKNQERVIQREKEYHKNHREEQRLYKKEYHQRNLEKDRKQSKQYYLAHKDEARRRQRMDRASNPEKFLQRERKYRTYFREETLKLFGNVCDFCGNPVDSERFEVHEINGKKHPSLRGRKRIEFFKSHPTEFRLLHFDCHKTVHSLMKRLGFCWDDIVDFKTRYHQLRIE